MALQEIIQQITEKLQSTASVKTVYGDPVSAEGKTVIPVARVAYGFGGGSGSCGAEDRPEGKERGEGTGGGGGIVVKPVGVVEISAEATRFIPVPSTGRLIGILAAGLILGHWMGKRRSVSR